MQVKSIAEYSAILLTFIKLPFVIKIFVFNIFEWLLIFVFNIFEWLFYTGFTVLPEYLMRQVSMTRNSNAVAFVT